MNLVDEQHIIRFEIGQQRGKVAGAFQHRTGSLAHIDAHFAPDDMRQRRLAESRGTKQQDVVKCLAASTRRLDKDRQLGTDLFLTDIVFKLPWP